MSFFTTGDGYSLRHLTGGYAWSQIGAGTVVDVGGSEGDAAFAIAHKYPDIRLIVQELPEVVAISKEQPGLNVKFMAHDFFKEQPIKNADVYLYRWVLHNWPDKHCVQILNSLVPALKPGARVLIMDFVMPPPLVLPNSIDRKLRCVLLRRDHSTEPDIADISTNDRAMDVTMLEIGNAKERNLSEWNQLLSQADDRFQLKGVTQPPGSNLAILEIEWRV